MKPETLLGVYWRAGGAVGSPGQGSVSAGWLFFGDRGGGRGRSGSHLAGGWCGGVVGAGFGVGEVVAEEGVNEAVAAADALKEAAFGAVAEEAAVVPGGVAEKPEGDAKDEVFDRAGQAAAESTEKKAPGCSKAEACIRVGVVQCSEDSYSHP